jgi:hypothetical protein
LYAETFGYMLLYSFTNRCFQAVLNATRR